MLGPFFKPYSDQRGGKTNLITFLDCRRSATQIYTKVESEMKYDIKVEAKKDIKDHKKDAEIVSLSRSSSVGYVPRVSIVFHL
jgi:hypothetical protein